MDIKNKIINSVLGLTMISTIGFSGEYFLNKDISILNEKFSESEYREIKKNILKLSLEQNFVPNSIEDRMWMAIVNKEIQDKCKVINIYKDIDTNKIVKKVKSVGVVVNKTNDNNKIKKEIAKKILTNCKKQKRIILIKK